MTGFRIPDSFPVFLDRLGQPAANGRLEFYDAGTSVPKDVYGNPDLTVNNGPTVLIGADGRAVDDIWGDGSYYVRLIAADDTLIADADDVSIPGGAGAVIPALAAGKFLTNDGAVMSWASIIQPPDPTGQAGKILGTDGTNLTWQNPPATPPPAVSDIDVTTVGMTASDGTAKLQIITGTATAPNVGGRDTNIAVTFPTAFNANPLFVGITPRYGGTVSAFGNAPIPHVSAISPTGFTAAFAAGERDDTNAGFNFNAAIPFDWVAIGLVNA
jgi:hypothetical protein